LGNPLRTVLSNMKPRPDSPHRGNLVDREVIGEHLRGLLLQRIDIGCQAQNCHADSFLSVADDHHEQLVRPDQSNRRPRGHRGTSQPMT
jgi:hypothetical protein